VFIGTDIKDKNTHNHQILPPQTVCIKILISTKKKAMNMIHHYIYNSAYLIIFLNIMEPHQGVSVIH